MSTTTATHHTGTNGQSDTPLTPRPSQPPSPQFENVPTHLRPGRRWVLWRWEWDGARWTKVLYRPSKPDCRASHSDPASWGTFDQTVMAYKFHCKGANPVDGIGVCMIEEDDILGIDIDHCIVDGEASPFAARFVEAFASYTERTPSGNGLRIYIRAKKPTKNCVASKLGPDQTGKVEFYETKRFFTFTGDLYSEGLTTIERGQEVLDAFYRELFGDRVRTAVDAGEWQSDTGELTDADKALVCNLCESVHPDIRTFPRLYLAGDMDGFASPSDADWALLKTLAKHVGNEPPRMERIANSSALARRPKWKDREDYRRRSIGNAIAEVKDQGQWWPCGEDGSLTCPGWNAAGSSPKRPVIFDGPEEKDVNDLAIAALTAEPNLYQRCNKLVTVLRDTQERRKRRDVMRPPDSPRIAELSAPRLRELLALHIVWKQKRKVGDKTIEVRSRPPAQTVAAVLARGEWEPIRPISGVVECPTLRPDGSILDTEGYDEATGLVYEPNADFLTVPDEPSLDEARKAAAALLKLVADFPFAKIGSDADTNDKGMVYKAAWLASLLTPLARAAIDGPCPLFLFDANTPGTGKSKLCDIISILATGREMARADYPEAEEEMAKTLLSVALAADLMTLFDNVTTGRAVGGKSIDRALTARTVKGRILGRSEMSGELPLPTVFYATGNNLGVSGDALRRIIPIRLESDHERPEERSDFSIKGDLLAYVKQNRPELVRHALLILKAYVHAKRPEPKLTPMDYPAWCGLIRNAVHWATGFDPCAGREERRESDPETIARAGLVGGWAELPDAVERGLTVSQALDELRRSPDAYALLRDTLMELSQKDELPSAQSIGMRLKAVSGRVIGDKQIKAIPILGHLTAWRVVTVEKGTKGTKGT